jgi:hypothetical protein
LHRHGLQRPGRPYYGSIPIRDDGTTCTLTDVRSGGGAGGGAADL